jgi:hypothetical protein
MLEPPAKQRLRRYFWIGLIVVAAGLWQGKQALESFRTGQPIHTLHYGAMEWWVEAAFSAGTVLFGLCAIGVGRGG